MDLNEEALMGLLAIAGIVLFAFMLGVYSFARLF